MVRRRNTLRDYSSLFSGVDIQVPTLLGEDVRYINLDNAASTPPIQAVSEGIDRFLKYYSSVHRGTGFKSQLSTWAYERSRDLVLDFVGADHNRDVCIFGKNATEAINQLARTFPWDNRDVVLVSEMEHHSNDLPYRPVAEVMRVKVRPDGKLDEEDFDRLLDQFADRVGLVALTGASNVTGWINPIHQLAEKAHAVGAKILIDCAQLAPHRRLKMRSGGDLEPIDFIALSAHKLYAPFGSGALVGPKELLGHAPIGYAGGGTVELVTTDEILWSSPPERFEAGSPNVVGAIAFGLAIKSLQAIGMESVNAHEAQLTTYALEKLNRVEGLKIYGGSNQSDTSNRLGVIPFELEGISHFLVAAILGYEFGIGVRSGCFCAHPYILKLLSLSEASVSNHRNRIQSRDRTDMPGLVRISFGLYNCKADVDALAAALAQIARREWKGDYQQDPETGEFTPRGWKPDFNQYFPF
jgi:selenocysteine lyase/cysteine desulfurase